MQVEKEVAKAVRGMEEVETELARKKGVNRQCKELRAACAANSAELQQLEATQQHLKRQQAALQDRLQRVEHQVGSAAVSRPADCVTGSQLEVASGACQKRIGVKQGWPAGWVAWAGNSFGKASWQAVQQFDWL